MKLSLICILPQFLGCTQKLPEKGNLLLLVTTMPKLFSSTVFRGIQASVSKKLPEKRNSVVKLSLICMMPQFLGCTQKLPEKGNLLLLATTMSKLFPAQLGWLEGYSHLYQKSLYPDSCEQGRNVCLLVVYKYLK